MLDKISLILVIVGAVNWGSVGLFGVDIVATLFGGGSMLAKILYTLIGLAGIWSISLLFKERDDDVVETSHAR